MSKLGQLHLDHSRVSKRSPWLVYDHSRVLKERLLSLSVILARHWALKVIRQLVRSVSLHEISHCLLLLLCSCFAHCPCFAHCCHDPFIVRSTQTCPPFLGFIQLAHPSRCSRSTLTTVCFCFCCIIGSSPSSCSGVWDPWSLEYQSCNLQCFCGTEARIGFVPTFAQFFSFLVLKSSSRTCSRIQKYRISLCSLCCPAFNRSVKEFSVSPSFNAVTL